METAPRPRFADALLRRRRAADLGQSFDGLTYLETIAVKAPARRLYLRLWEQFMGIAATRVWLPLVPTSIDDHLAIVVDEWLSEGLPPGDGSKLIAAVKHMVPALRRQGPVRLPHHGR